MAHEIYYTSAPAGLKPGHTGLCTVAATEGIPRPLWERLEALSGYRHFREAGSRDNPVAFAHWTVTVAGRTWHVLSRICDSGFDYTNRNNIFAHHLALESSEMAPAGPAWMLLQPGVMVETWDGTVGWLKPARPLPAGDIFPIRCTTWERASGDAGWAGVLAETVTRKPPRPVCIIYPPGTDVLGLVDEALRLLPADLRWQATFNTFFASLPAGATCVWRCCLAGTHAADLAARWAATGGLIIDLSSPKRLPPPDGPWAEAARNGTPVATAPEKQTIIEWPSAKHTPARSPATNTKAPKPAQPQPDAGTVQPAEPSVVRRAGRRDPVVGHPASAPAPAPWRRVAVPYLLACLTIGAGTLLVMYWSKALSPPSTVPSADGIARSPVPADTHGAAATTPPASPATRPAESPRTPAQPVVQTATPEPSTRPVEHVATTQGADPAPPEYDVVLDERPAWPGAGAALRDRTQTIPLPATGPRWWSAATALTPALPDNAQHYAYRGEDAVGMLVISPAPATQGPGFRMHWKDETSAAQLELLAVAMDTTRGQLELTWRSAAIMRRPEAAAVAFWLMHGCPLLAAERPGGPVHRIRFAPMEPPALDIFLPRSALELPAGIPAGASVEIEGLSADWRVETRRHAAPQPPSQPGARPSWLTIEMTRLQQGQPTDLVIKLHLAAGLRAVESDLGQQVQTYRRAAETAQKELATVEAALRKLIVDAETDMKHNERLFPDPEELKTANATRSALLAEQRKPHDARKVELQELLRGYQATLAAYDEVKAIRMTVVLPGGIRVLSVPLERK